MNLCCERDLRDLLARHGARLSKSMGQNFLIDPAVPYDIAAASGADKSCCVLEIGPGVGALTVQLAPLAGKVVAVELDRTLLPILGESLAPFPNVEVIPGDILKLNLTEVLDSRFAGYRPVVCANLPYNITSPVIAALLACGRFESLTLMVQREVAERICGGPGSNYGAFSVFCQYHARCELLFAVPPSAFLPPPKVTSYVMRLVPYATSPWDVADEDFFFRVVRGAFAQRRKTLLNALSAAFPHVDKGRLRELISRCGLPEDIRGERLSIPTFATLAQMLAGAAT